MLFLVLHTCLFFIQLAPTINIQKNKLILEHAMTTTLSNIVVPKYWQHIYKRLIARSELYYFGGTLCVDNLNGPGGLGLNLNGRGFVYTHHSYMNNSTFYMPTSILTLVRTIYLETKGHTQHYSNSIIRSKKYVLQS